MHCRALGRTGIKVSPYALGALALGTYIGNPDHDDSVRIIHRALDAGINGMGILVWGPLAQGNAHRPYP